MKLSKSLVLGSKSPRRAELLSALGFEFTVKVTDADENAPKHLSGQETAVWIAEQKAKALQPLLGSEELGITSDTEVWLEARRYGKPGSEAEAVEMIASLQGKMHEVHTGLTLCSKSSMESFCSTVQVHLKPMSLEEIEHYVLRFAPLDKAGAYGIQEWIGHAFIERIDGEYNAVVGLPTATLYNALKKYKD